MRQAPSIDAYGGGGFRIDGVRHEGSVLIIDDSPEDRRLCAELLNEKAPGKWLLSQAGSGSPLARVAV